MKVNWNKVGALGNIGLLIFNAINTYINIKLFSGK